MRYFKQWKEHPEKLKKENEPVGWFEVTQEDTIMHLTGNVREYGGIDSTPEQIEKKLSLGDILHSSTAMYIAIEVEPDPLPQSIQEALNSGDGVYHP